MKKLTLWTSAGRTFLAEGTDSAKPLRQMWVPNVQGTTGRPVQLERIGDELRVIMKDQVEGPYKSLWRHLVLLWVKWDFKHKSTMTHIPLILIESLASLLRIEGGYGMQVRKLLQESRGKGDLTRVAIGKSEKRWLFWTHIEDGSNKSSRCETQGRLQGL